MPQYHWIVWVLDSALANLTKVAKITKTINLAQLALLVVKKTILPQNTGLTCSYHSLLMLPTIQKDTRDARYTL